MAAILLNAIQLLTIVSAPLLLFTLVIHQLERFSQRRLAERFGWHSILWTGWLGTPIHELSHAALCVVFRHRIDDMALFAPDFQAGRLGYVRHSYTKGNLFEEFGNLFIGLAPLAGGSIALAALLWVFFPDAVEAVLAVNHDLKNGSPAALTTTAHDLVMHTVSIMKALFGQVFTVDHLTSGRFWWFLYLVLCVGSHMAPSRSDYAGAKVGVGIFLITALVAALMVAIAASFFGGDRVDLVRRSLELISPILALLILAVALCGVATVVVHVVTSFFPVRYKVG